MVTWPLLRNMIRRNLASNTFGWVRKTAEGAPKPHQGWDLQATVGTPVYAVGSGKVVFVRNHGAYGLQLCHSFSFRNQVYYAFYAHLLAVRVAQGAPVTFDQEIALTGKSGNASNLPASEDHLHFEIRHHPNLGLGLVGRISPLTIFRSCPLHHMAAGDQVIQ